MGLKLDDYKSKIDEISTEIFSLSADTQLEIQKNDLALIREFKDSYIRLESVYSDKNASATDLLELITSTTVIANKLSSSFEGKYKYGTRLKTFGSRTMLNTMSIIDSLRDSGVVIPSLSLNEQTNKDDYEKKISEAKNELEKLKETTIAHLRDTKTEISNLAKIAEKLRSDIHSLEEDMLSESKKASAISNAATEHAKEAQANIDNLLETTSSKVLLLEYSTTADEEEASANKMRWLSLICMTITATILLLALYDTLNKELDWKQSILRMFIAIALSVPAAYLARESAKHRSQQHISRRIALDLKAVTPYISSLPEADQIKIKSEVASRIFGIHNNEAASDSYPLNVQELIKNLIEKIPNKKD